MNDGGGRGGGGGNVGYHHWSLGDNETRDDDWVYMAPLDVTSKSPATLLILALPNGDGETGRYDDEMIKGPDMYSTIALAMCMYVRLVVVVILQHPSHLHHRRRRCRYLAYELWGSRHIAPVSE